MKDPIRILAAAALASAAVLALAAGAAAESRDPRTHALGWQTENADAVVVAVPVQDRGAAERGPREIDLRVEESIRGRPAAGEVLVLRAENHGEALPCVLGVRHLCFLRALPSAEGEPQRWALL